jgi:hypothetical protein
MKMISLQSGSNGIYPRTITLRREHAEPFERDWAATLHYLWLVGMLQPTCWKSENASVTRQSGRSNESAGAE